MNLPPAPALRAAILAVVFLLLVSCVGSTDDQSRSEPPRTASPSPTKTKVGTRPPTVILQGGGKGERLIARGIRGVKGIGLWKRLTKHLVGMTFKAYNGHHRVPPDRHLADAVYTVAQNTRGETGLYCDVVFFTTAMMREARQLRSAYELGYIQEAPPNLSELYASVVAHELGHCQIGAHNEKAAREWEKRAVRRLRNDRN